MSRRHSQRHNTLIASTLALTISIALAAGNIAASDDMANVRVTSVTPAGIDTYDISGIAVDKDVNLANALVLASGRCMFSAGQGAMRCEGGTSDLPLGRFELFDLPVEDDGTISLQVFIEGHVSLATPIAPEPPLSDEVQWGVFNDFCCPSERTTFEVTIGGVTKRSVESICSQNPQPWRPTFEGWASISLENNDSEVQVQAEVAQTDETDETCGEPFSTVRTDILKAGGCYMYRLEAVNGNPEVVTVEVDCDTLR